MINKIKNYFIQQREYNHAKKTITLAAMNQYYDFLIMETETKKAEKAAYESMTAFGDGFNLENLESIFQDIHKIANNPDLTSQFYAHIADTAKE